MYSFEEFAALGAAKPAAPTPPAAEDYCTIMYTSGTTGDPKARTLLVTLASSSFCILFAALPKRVSGPGCADVQ